MGERRHKAHLKNVSLTDEERRIYQNEKCKLPASLDGSGEYMDQISELRAGMKWFDTLNAFITSLQISLIFIEVTLSFTQERNLLRQRQLEQHRLLPPQDSHSAHCHCLHRHYLHPPHLQAKNHQVQDFENQGELYVFLIFFSEFRPNWPVEGDLPGDFAQLDDYSSWNRYQV